MKRLIFCTMMLPTAVATGQVTMDHGYHAIAGCAVGLFTANTARKPLKATLLYTAGLGAAKEFYDRRNGGRFDPADAAATVLGGVTAYCIVKLLKRKHKHATRHYPLPLH